MASLEVGNKMAWVQHYRSRSDPSFLAPQKLTISEYPGTRIWNRLVVSISRVSTFEFLFMQRLECKNLTLSTGRTKNEVAGSV